MFRNSVICLIFGEAYIPISRLSKSDFPMGIFCVVTSNNFFHFTFLHSRLLMFKIMYFNSFLQNRPPFLVIQLDPTKVLKGRKLNYRYLLKYSVTE